MFKKDSFLFGIIIGLVLPLIIFGIFFLINKLLVNSFNFAEIKRNTVVLVSVFSNLLPIRLYFVNLKMDKTGRGILGITFFLMILFFIFIRTSAI